MFCAHRAESEHSHSHEHSHTEGSQGDCCGHDHGKKDCCGHDHGKAEHSHTEHSHTEHSHKDSSSDAVPANIAEAKAAHLEAKKALAHAEAKERDGQMPKRMVASIRRREVAAKEALDAAIAGNPGAAASEAPKQKVPRPAVSVGQEWLASSPKWAVIGDVLNQAKPAARVVSSLQGMGKTVHLVNPRDKTKQCFAGLSDIGAPLDVVNLCINSVTGLKMMEQAAALGVEKVFIQPGAESPEILAFCAEKGIVAYQGCVMVDLGGDH